MQIIFYFDFFNELTCARHAQSHELDYRTAHSPRQWTRLILPLH